MSKYWVREGGRLYEGAAVLQTAAFWKVIGFFVGIPAAVVAALVVVDKLSKC